MCQERCGGVVYVAGIVLTTILLMPVRVAIIQRKEPLMSEQHTADAATSSHDAAADKVEDVLGKRTGGTEEHPVEGRADEAQRETPHETRQNQGTQEGEQ